jgi:hypothetical protein
MFMADSNATAGKSKRKNPGDFHEKPTGVFTLRPVIEISGEFRNTRRSNRCPESALFGTISSDATDTSLPAQIKQIKKRPICLQL